MAYIEFGKLSQTNGLSITQYIYNILAVS